MRADFEQKCQALGILPGCLAYTECIDMYVNPHIQWLYEQYQRQEAVPSYIIQEMGELKDKWPDHTVWATCSPGGVWLTHHARWDSVALRSMKASMEVGNRVVRYVADN